MRFLALLLLSGCASADVICDMRIDYAQMTQCAEAGSVGLHWQWGAVPPSGVYGLTQCDGGECFITLRGKAPDFSDVCGLAKLGHEVCHAMGGSHEPAKGPL